MLLPEDNFGNQLQHMISFQTAYPFDMQLDSSMQLEGLKLLFSNIMDVNIEVG